MSQQETIRDVPADKVDALVARFEAIGAKVQKFPQGDGRFTVVATFPQSGHSTAFATQDAAETTAKLLETADAPAAALSTSVDFADLAQEYRTLFDTCVLAKAQRAALQARVEHLQANAARYRALGQALDVPWFFIGITHSMESNFNFATHLHNGDALAARTVREPVGQPKKGTPPFTWETSAEDALRSKGFVGQSDWSLARMLHRWEAYNGFGYRRKAMASPYLWSFTQHYKKGLFVRDHEFDAKAVSKQPGAAALLKALQHSLVNG